QFPSTCWTEIRDAAAGDDAARERFARRYQRPVEAYLGHKWRGSWLRGAVEEAVQEVFVEGFKPKGVLKRADPERKGGFRAFLLGVVKKVALRLETRRAREQKHRLSGEFSFEDVAGSDAEASSVYEREWEQLMLRMAIKLHAERARE